MVDAFADLSLEDEETQSIRLGSEAFENVIAYDLFFLGSFLTSSRINFPAMKSTLANVYHLVGGLAISDLGNDKFLFRFYFEVDAQRIEKNGPWTFSSHLLILHRLKDGDDPLVVPLYWVDL